MLDMQACNCDRIPSHAKSVSITPLFPNDGEKGGQLFSEVKKGFTRRIWYHPHSLSKRLADARDTLKSPAKPGCNSNQ
ncbi:MAG TPA: hypothetical protein V6C91_09315 [Coleofasciculaceae cyanobacterium]